MLFISTKFYVSRSVISFLLPDLYFTYIRFQQNSDSVRSVPQVVKVWMPPACTFRKLVHILWLAAAVILMRQLPCSAFRKCVFATFRWWHQQLQSLLSDTDIAPEITQSPILQKRGTCFSHSIVVCTVQTVGAIVVGGSTVLMACVTEGAVGVWVCVWCHRLDGLCSGRSSRSVCVCVCVCVWCHRLDVLCSGSSSRSVSVCVCVCVCGATVLIGCVTEGAVRVCVCVCVCVVPPSW